MIDADRELLKRELINLIQNSISHNENGCTIYVSAQSAQGECIICIEDNGIGVSDKQIEALNTEQHYKVCDESAIEQRHGLGLLIVKQIVFAHHGEMIIDHSTYGGFKVTLALPKRMDMPENCHKE